MFEIIVIIAVILLIIYFLKNKNTYNKKRKYVKKPQIKNITKNITKNSFPEEIVLKGELIEIQYHVDYSDTITAINKLTPQKELFNLAFLPVKNSTPSDENSKELVNIFINAINTEISKAPDFLNVNSGWNDVISRRREKTNQEKQLESLGIPSKIYNTPSPKAQIKLLKIDKAEQFTTDNQIRIEIHVIIQKENVEDQMVLMIQFFMEKENDNFFDKDLKNNDFKTSVLIERIFIVGFLTNDTILKTKMEKFYEYDDILREDGTMNQEKVLKMMIQKHKDRNEELNSFTQTLDKDTQKTHFNAEPVFKNRKTIIDNYTDRFSVYN